jgi:DNA-binding transcriptional LysR family regulator
MKTTLDELLAFITVVDTGSISAAAEHLDQTVSGVSRALRRLEDKLKTTLIRRTTRRLELTEEGGTFLQQARKILELTEEAEDQIAGRRHKPAGRLRVNAASPFMLHVIVPLVGGFRTAYPEIELELHTSDEIINLLEQRTDVAIRIGTLRDSSLHARHLGNSRQRILASPGYVKARGAPRNVGELHKHSLLGYTPGGTPNLWPLRSSLGDRLRIVPNVFASSGETLRQLALAGGGLVCLSDYVTVADRKRGDLVQVLMRETVDISRPISAVYYRDTQLGSRIRCFLDYVGSRMSDNA